MRKIYGSLLFKLLTVVLLAVTIPASLWCGYGMVFFGEGLLAKNLSFADSKAALKLSEGYAEEIYIISSGELMSLYAANNIANPAVITVGQILLIPQD